MIDRTIIVALLVIAFSWALLIAVALLPDRLTRHKKLPPLPPLPEGSLKRPF